MVDCQLLIMNNTCLNYTEYGIWVSKSNNNYISNNTCQSGNQGGIYIDYSDNNVLYNNTCSLNQYEGIRIICSKNNELFHNQMIKDSLYISGFFEHFIFNSIDTTNKVNGKPVYYYVNTTKITIPSGAGQIIVAYSSQITIENQNCSDCSAGILIVNSSFMNISNNTCLNNNYGIFIMYIENSTISENNCSNNTSYGIGIYSSNNSVIFKNKCFYNNYGMYPYYCNNNTFTNNICINNDNYGVFFRNSNYNRIKNNTCSNNSKGISLFFSDNNTLSYNICDNNNIGIFLNYYSSQNIAFSNNIFNNIEYGIYVSTSNSKINAIYNWWGNSSGPFHSVNNSDGKGDNVTDNVIFDPWLKSPVTEMKNLPPIANAGDDRTVYINEDVQLIGTGTDVDGEIIKYEWDFNGDGEYDWESTTNGKTTYIFTKIGTYNATLRVTDNIGAKATDICIITVKEHENNPPTINLQFPSNGATITTPSTILYWESNDNDGDSLTFDIYLDTNPNPSIKVSEYQKEKLYTVSELINSHFAFQK